MTVADLIKSLQALPPDDEVYAEGDSGLYSIRVITDSPYGVLIAPSE